MRKIVLLIFFLSAHLSYAQNNFQFEVDLGYAFQREMKLNGEDLDNTGAFGMRFGVNYVKGFNDLFSMETGIYGKYNRGERHIKSLEFTTNNLKLQIPLFIGYTINDDWRLNLGASIENNKDFDEFDIHTKENFRYDLLTKVVYMYSDELHFSFYTNWMLNDTPDVYTISSPRNGLYLGVIYQLGRLKTTE